MRRLRLAAALGTLAAASALAACDLLMTEPAEGAPGVSVSFELHEGGVGGEAVAFMRVNRVFLRLVRPDSLFRDTIVPAVPSEGVIRTRLAVETVERVEGLGIGAQLRVGPVGLFQGGTIVAIQPGVPTQAQIELSPIPAALQADRDSLRLAGPGLTATLGSTLTFATGDTITSLAGVWRSEDPAIVAITPAGSATALAFGTTRLEVRFDLLADTVWVSVTP